MTEEGGGSDGKRPVSIGSVLVTFGGLAAAAALVTQVKWFPSVGFVIVGCVLVSLALGSLLIKHALRHNASSAKLTRHLSTVTPLCLAVGLVLGLGGIANFTPVATPGPTPTTTSSPSSVSTPTVAPIDVVGDTKLAQRIAFGSADVPSGWVTKSVPGTGTGVDVSGCAAALGSGPAPTATASSTWVDRPGTIFYSQVSSYVEVLPAEAVAIARYGAEGQSAFLSCLRQFNEGLLRQQGLGVSSSKGNFLPNTTIGSERMTDESIFMVTSDSQTSRMTEDLVIGRKGRVVVFCFFISLNPPFPPNLAEQLLRNIDARL